MNIRNRLDGFSWQQFQNNQNAIQLSLKLILLITSFEVSIVFKKHSICRILRTIMNICNRLDGFSWQQSPPKKKKRNTFIIETHPVDHFILSINCFQKLFNPPYFAHHNERLQMTWLFKRTKTKKRNGWRSWEINYCYIFYNIVQSKHIRNLNPFTIMTSCTYTENWINELSCMESFFELMK